MGGTVAVTGVGMSADMGRDTGRTEGELALQACRVAIVDAGLEPPDIDGWSMYPYRTKPPNPFSGPELPYVHRSLGTPLARWFQANTGENGQLGPVMAIVDALAAGRCTHVLCYRAHLRQARRYLAGGADPTLAYDEDEHTLPYGAGSGTARGALWAARYMAVNGVTQRQLGGVSVNARAHAARNPKAYWRTPVTIESTSTPGGSRCRSRCSIATTPSTAPAQWCQSSRRSAGGLAPGVGGLSGGRSGSGHHVGHLAGEGGDGLALGGRRDVDPDLADAR